MISLGFLDTSYGGIRRNRFFGGHWRGGVQFGVFFLVVYVSFFLAVLPFAVPGSSEFDVTFWGFEVWHFLFGRSRYPFFGLVLFGPFDFFF